MHFFSIALAALAAVAAATPARLPDTPEFEKRSNSGIATFFSQNGNAGACGQTHGDDSLIVAIDSAKYSQSLCGSKVRVTNTSNGKSVEAVIADECPTCKNGGSLDLSKAAFEKIGEFEKGELPISWEMSG